MSTEEIYPPIAVIESSPPLEFDDDDDENEDITVIPHKDNNILFPIPNKQFYGKLFLPRPLCRSLIVQFEDDKMIKEFPSRKRSGSHILSPVSKKARPSTPESTPECITLPSPPTTPITYRYIRHVISNPPPPSSRNLITSLPEREKEKNK